MPESNQIRTPEHAGPIVQRIKNVLKREIGERSGVAVLNDKADLTIELSIVPGMGTEGFRIEDGERQSIRIVGNDELGLFYGVGKFLRSSRYEQGSFIPGEWRGTSVPEAKIRGIFFATHFHNFYDDAPIEEIERYLEELVLWGYNAFSCVFDMFHYNGIDDPWAQKVLRQNHRLLSVAKSIGMKIGISSIANESYKTSPEELLANHDTGRWNYKLELCPSKPGAKELMLKQSDEEYRFFADLELDYLWVWPHDSGGCACEKCWPWGAKGFPMMAEAISKVFRKYFPNGKIVLSTWLFDFLGEHEGEWKGLSDVLSTTQDWAHYLLVDSHGDFPKYPLEHGAPGGLPMINFPEISMLAMVPWGGFGANPMPTLFQRLWRSVSHVIDGGYPYSEGIYEDINKVLIIQFYWKKDADARDALREYIAYEFSPEIVDDVVEAVDILEENSFRSWNNGDFGLPLERVVLPPDAGSERAHRLLETANSKLSPRARSSWRWRILYLRALIDNELYKNDGVPTPKCDEAFDELTRIYYADEAVLNLKPPARAVREESKNGSMKYVGF